MLKKDAREPYKENGVAQCFQGLRRFCFQTRDTIHLFYQLFFFTMWSQPNHSLAMPTRIRKLLRAVAERHMSNKKGCCLHTSMTQQPFLFAAWLNCDTSCQNCHSIFY